MRRTLTVVALAAAMVIAMAGTALAGEVTGSGKGGPAGDGIPGAVAHGQSACLYSGLEDGSEDPTGPAGPGAPPQNWGHTKDAPIVIDSRGASWVLIDLTFLGYGIIEEGCNPHVFGGPHQH